MLKTVLITGGAGYIGSHAVRAFIKAGLQVVVVDNLSKGHQEAVDKKAVMVKANIADLKSMRRVFSDYKFDAVIHFAGSIDVGLSMREPLTFFENNFINGIKLLEVMRNADVNKIIFSSTAAVYGNPLIIPIKEDASLSPTNFYGVSKLMFEEILKKYEQFYGFQYISLRYFNAAGADESGEIGQDYKPDTHLIPCIVKAALGINESFSIFGTDYATDDGSCIRDYIHVTDLVDAHLLAFDYLFTNGFSDIFNLGNGHGFSVREVLKVVEKFKGGKIKIKEIGRREGDPAILIADSQKARKILGWKPVRSDLNNIIGTAWKWHRQNKFGYVN